MIAADLIQQLRLDLLLRLVFAVVLGSAVGYERQRRRKAVGIRTTVLICVGAALFTDLSLTMAGPLGDPSRIAAQIVTGVGFLGAGSIIQSGGAVHGLTTAATIWLVAAIGMAVGFGALVEATGATVLVLLVLSVLKKAELSDRVRRAASSGGKGEHEE